MTDPSDRDAPGPPAAPVPIAAPPGFGVTIDSFGAGGGNAELVHEDLRHVDHLGGNWVRVNVSAAHLVESWERADGGVVLRQDAVAQMRAVLHEAEDRGLSVCLMYVDTFPDPEAPLRTWTERTEAWWEAISAAFAPAAAMVQVFNEATGFHPRLLQAVPSDEQDAYLVEFAAALDSARTIVHRHAPGAVVTTNLYGWPVGDAIEERWVRELEVLAPVQDVITVDAYVDWGVAGWETLHDLPERMARLRERFGRPVVLGEIGVSDHGIAPEVQADRIATIVQVLKDAVPEVHAVFLYQMRDWDGAEGHEARFGLLEADGTPKPAYTRLEEIGLEVPAS